MASLKFHNFVKNNGSRLSLRPNFWISGIIDTSIKAFAHFLQGQKIAASHVGNHMDPGLSHNNQNTFGCLQGILVQLWKLALGRMDVGGVLDGKASEKLSKKVNH